MNLLLLEIYILYILLGLYIYIIEYIIIGEKIGKLDNCHIVGLLNLIFSEFFYHVLFNLVLTIRNIN